MHHTRMQSIHLVYWLFKKGVDVRALVFGVGGQDGHYLSLACHKRGIEVIGVDICGSHVQGSVADYEFVKRVVQQQVPDYIFHLAAKSTTKHDALFDNHQIISTGTLNILESARLFSPQTKIFIAESGLLFKNSGNPISETDTFEALSPYAVARIQSVYASRYYRTLGLRVYNGYLFHHESPLRPANHVSKLISLFVQNVARGCSEKIELGDIFVEKEWSFAGDIVEGILTLIEQDTIFETVIGSGKSYSIKDWLERCFCLIGKDWRDFVVIKDAFVPEYKRLVSNPQTIFSLGWMPKVSFSQLAQMMVLDLMNGKDVLKEKNSSRSIGSAG